jgi:hypothetical protein
MYASLSRSKLLGKVKKLQGDVKDLIEIVVDLKPKCKNECRVEESAKGRALKNVTCCGCGHCFHVKCMVEDGLLLKSFTKEEILSLSFRCEDCGGSVNANLPSNLVRKTGDDGVLDDIACFRRIEEECESDVDEYHDFDRTKSRNMKRISSENARKRVPEDTERDTFRKQVERLKRWSSSS